MEPLNAANPYGATVEEVLAGETLTGDALMTYIATRLSSLDEDIKMLIGQQQEALAKKQYINQVRDWAGGLEHGATPSAGPVRTDRLGRPIQAQPSIRRDMNAQQLQEARAEVDSGAPTPSRGMPIQQHQTTNAVADLGASQPTVPPGSFPGGGAELGDLPEQLYQAFQDHCGPGKGVDEDTLKSFTAKLDSVLDEINGASELNMIRLQQLMGQRQVCVQLTTNLLSKLTSGEESIAANFR